MSYRRKRAPSPGRPDQFSQFSPLVNPTEATYGNPGVDKVIHSARLISGQAYQRPVREENVNDGLLIFAAGLSLMLTSPAAPFHVLGIRKGRMQCVTAFSPEKPYVLVGCCRFLEVSLLHAGSHSAANHCNF